MGPEVSPLCCMGHVFTCVCTAGFHLSVKGVRVESRPDLGSQEQPPRGDTTLEITGGNSTFMSLDFYDSNEGDNMEDLIEVSGF